MEIHDLPASMPGDAACDMVRIDPMTAIPRWEERTVVHEHVLSLSVNGRAPLELVCTPQELPALAAGHLLCSGMVTSAADIRSISISADGCRADVKTRRTAGAGRGGRVPTTGRAPLGLDETCTPLPPFRWEPRWVYMLARAFADGAPLYRSTHGIHSCFLMHDGDIRFCCEDIGRHNALDKAVGRAMIEGIDLSQCVLFSSGRIPADMMEKAIRARVPVLVSNAVPTDRAVELALQYRVVLICSARKDSMNVFSERTLWR